MPDIDAIYGGQVPPYRSWLEVTDQKDNLAAWLSTHVPRLKLTNTTRIPSPVDVLDLGCSSGDMSLRLLKVLRRQLGLAVVYTGVDPSADQLATFQRIADTMPAEDIELVQSGMLEFQPPSSAKYDLVFVSHSLYYVADLNEALRHILSLGREVIIVHHGERGINTVQQAFREHAGKGPHIISTAREVRYRLLDVMSIRDRRTVLWDGFESTVDISSCVDPESQRGKNLIGFFLSCNFADIPPDVVDNVRAFLRRTYEPLGYRMPHDDGITIVS